MDNDLKPKDIYNALHTKLKTAMISDFEFDVDKYMFVIGRSALKLLNDDIGQYMRNAFMLSSNPTIFGIKIFEDRRDEMGIHLYKEV